MDMGFIRCSYFCILKQDETEFILNPFHNQEGDIAALVVQWLIEKDITLLITGEISSVAKKSLKQAQIQTVLIDNDKNTMQTILDKHR